MSKTFRALRLFVPAAAAVLLSNAAQAQDTATPNGIADNRSSAFAFTNANLYTGNGNIESGSLLIRDGRIVNISSDDAVPPGYFEIDLQGRYIYPGLIDIYANLGLTELDANDSNGAAENLFPSAGALNANDAIRSNYRASTDYTPDEEAIEKLRELGFSTVLNLRPDGIAS